ncbi:16S rRNA processing protein RimM [candidate division BRC1 bacterium HGW-BRC1-1]|jgi:16S rRNA processing protein RimM|nr:MAG: 16S rRNA processing protein RimM [candidate division BRC1 bacterium HGW-BRC1-1]
MNNPDDLVAIGIITRTHGNAGAVRMSPLFEPIERFEQLPSDEIILRLPRRLALDLGMQPASVPPPEGRADLIHATAHVEDYFFHQQHVILTLAEIPDMTNAEKLRAIEVLLTPADLWPLEPGEFYHWQWIGCAVLDDSTGEKIGEVLKIDAGSAHDFLRVQPAEGKAFLVPMVKQMVVSTDMNARTVRVAIPPGLTDL